MKKIAIIGLGQLGSRHLQALALVSEPLHIELVDISNDSLQTAYNRFYEVNNSKNFKGVIEKYNSVHQLSPELDIVIIACNSKERRMLTEQLIRNKKVSHLILEKVLFPSLEDYKEVSELLSEKKVTTWVNCSRRSMPSYQRIKQLLLKNEVIDMTVAGSNWGMGSNGIHFIDLFCYLTDSNNIKLNTSLLDQTNPIESSRKGYIDYTGTITGQNDLGSIFKMSSYNSGKLPIQVVIQSASQRIVINEYLSNCVVYNEKNSWKGENLHFEILFQSTLTSLLVHNILTNGKCHLPTFIEASIEHRSFLSSLMEYETKKTGKQINSCLIT